MIFQIEPIDWFWFVLTSLAIWRSSTFLVQEEGPFGLSVRIRGAVVRMGAGKLISCHHCISVWLAGLWVLLVYRPQLAYVVLIPAAAGVSSALERFLSGGGEVSEEDNA